MKSTIKKQRSFINPESNYKSHLVPVWDYLKYAEVAPGNFFFKKVNSENEILSQHIDIGICR